jgi:hypothetical protein
MTRIAIAKAIMAIPLPAVAAAAAVAVEGRALKQQKLVITFRNFETIESSRFP